MANSLLTGSSAVVLAVAMSLLTTPVPGLGQERPWTVEDVMELRSPGSVEIDPSGVKIVYAISWRDLDENENQSDLWLAERNGSEGLRLTRDGTGASPSWAPDGRWIAFLSARDGQRQVYGIRPDGGEAWRVTDSPTGVQAFQFSPDGAQLAFRASGERDEAWSERDAWRGHPMVWDSAYATDWSHLWTVHLADGVAGDAQRVSPEGHAVGGFVWSPDGGSLAWSASTMADEETLRGRERPTGIALESDVYVRAIDGNSVQQVTRMRGGVQPEAWVPGLGLIVSGTGQELGTYNRQLWLADLEGLGGEARSLTAALDEHAGFVAASARELLVEVRHRTGGRLYRIPLGTGAEPGEPEVVTDDSLFYTNFSSDQNLEQLAFLGQGPQTPPNIYVSSVHDFSASQITDLNPQVASLALGEQRVVEWSSSADGEEIEGVLTLPVGYQEGNDVPLLLIIHGGPAAVSSNSFNPGGRYSTQVWAGLGYASLQPNYRGSTGYGERFRGLNRGDISGRDWVDIDSGVDHLIEIGIADADRLGIMGWSFGGHHTFWGITQTDRFRAASAGAGANALVSMYSQTDRPGFYHTYLGPRPWEDFSLYEERSAYRHVERVTTPLLIQVGEDDLRVPADQSIQFYEAMTGIGQAPAKLVIYPEEGHGIRHVPFVRDLMMRNIEWFSHWIPTEQTTAADDGNR